MTDKERIDRIKDRIEDKMLEIRDLIWQLEDCYAESDQPFEDILKEVKQRGCSQHG